MRKIIDYIIDKKIIIIPFCMLFILIFSLHFYMNLTISDDAIFCNILKEQNLFQFMHYLYFELNGKIFTDAMAAIFTYINPVFFKTFSSLLYVVIAYCIYYIFFDKDSSMRWVTCCTICFLPFYLLTSAGYVATSTNYIWTTAALFVVFTGIKRTVDQKSNNCCYMLVYTISAIYAGGQEVTCAIFLVIYLVFKIYFIYKRKKHFMINYGLLIALLSLVFILIAPGHKARSVGYSIFRIPNYIQLGLGDKLYLGISSTIAHFIDFRVNLFILFCIIIAICVIFKKEKIIYKCISIIPLVITIATLCILKLSDINSFISKIKEEFMYEFEWGYGQKCFKPVDVFNYDSWIAYLPTVVIIVFIMSIIISLFIISDTYEEFGIYLLVIGAGFCSRVVMAFSPTLFGSSSRTFIYFYFALMVLSLLLIKKIEGKWRYVVNFITVLGAGITFLISYVDIIR